MLSPPTFDIELVSASMLAPKVRELVFTRTDSAPFVFEAGQWVSLLLNARESAVAHEPGASTESGRSDAAGERTRGDGAGELRRAYSIASRPDGTPRFSLAVTLVDGGPGSAHLHALRVGERLRAIGPQGFFTRRNGLNESALFVATGTGITPLRSMVADARLQSVTAPSTLLFGVRHEEDILYRGELAAYESDVFQFVPTLSKPGSSWGGATGYVQTHVPRLYDELKARSPSAPHVYICGLQKMVSTVRDLLKNELGLPRELVHSERYD